MRTTVLCALGIVSMTMVHARSATAAEIKILSSPPARPILEALAPQWEKATGNTMQVVYRTAFAIKKQIDDGETFDLAVLPREVMDEVIQGGHARADTRKGFARIPIGLGIRAGQPMPDIGSVEGFKQALLGVKSFAYTQGAMSGRHVLKLIGQLGIEDAMKPKLKMASGGQVAVELVSQGEAEMNVDLVPEMLRWPNVVVLTPLPAELRNDIQFQVAMASKASQPQAAAALIALLTSPTGSAATTANGMIPEPPAAAR